MPTLTGSTTTTAVVGRHLGRSYGPPLAPSTGWLCGIFGDEGEPCNLAPRRIPEYLWLRRPGGARTADQPRNALPTSAASKAVGAASLQGHSGGLYLMAFANIYRDFPIRRSCFTISSAKIPALCGSPFFPTVRGRSTAPWR